MTSTPPPPPPQGPDDESSRDSTFGQGYTPPPPPPPPPGGAPGAYGAPAPAPVWDVGTALSYGWAKFQANAGQIVIAALALLVALVVVGAVGFGITAALTSSAECTTDPATGTFSCTNGTGLIAGLIVNALVVALLLVALQIVGAGIIRGALDITEGRPFQAANIFKFEKIVPVVVASLIVAAATFVGTILCYLPGLIIGFMTSYTLFFIMDRDMAPVDAIKASFNLVKDNLTNTLIWYVVGGIVATVGFVLCGIGALVSVPVVLIGTAFTYKKLTEQPVAA